jgi:hypothetical protein
LWAEVDPLLDDPRPEGIKRPQGWELLLTHLEHPPRRTEIPQAMLTQIDHNVLPDQRGGHRRAQHLTTMPDGHQAGRFVDSRAEIVPAALLYLAGVQPHPHPDRYIPRPLHSHKPCLGRCRRLQRVAGPSKRRREPVTASGEHVTTMTLDLATDDAIVDR